MVDPISGTHPRFTISSLPPTRVMRASPAKHVSYSAVGDCLMSVDELGEGATGAFVFGDPASSVGAILVEKGRICWAVASGFSRRLTDLLRHQSEPAIPLEKIEAIVSRCRGEGGPLGEALVQAQLVTEQGLRSALKQQTSEAVAVIAGSGHLGRFLPHRKATYDPKYCFSTTEILGAVGSLQSDDTNSLTARSDLRRVVRGVASGAVFVRSRGHALLLGVEEHEGALLSAERVVKMSSWALGQLDVAGAVAEGLKLVSSSAEDGNAIVAWQDGSLVFVALCKTQQALARVLMGASRR